MIEMMMHIMSYYGPFSIFLQISLKWIFKLAILSLTHFSVEWDAITIRGALHMYCHIPMLRPQEYGFGVFFYPFKGMLF